jgi:hypothetical protein
MDLIYIVIIKINYCKNNNYIYSKSLFSLPVLISSRDYTIMEIYSTKFKNKKLNYYNQK